MVPCYGLANRFAKIPRVKWRPYQTRRATEEEIIRWELLYPGANVAVLTGALNGLVVVDCDTTEAVTAVERMLDGPTISVDTGRGRHFYMRHPGGVLGNRTRVLAGVDVRGDGGYVLAPESLHPSGGTYRWIRAPWEVAPAPIPEALRTILTRPRDDGTARILGARILDEGNRRPPHDVRGRDDRSRDDRRARIYGTAALAREVERLRAIPLDDGNNKEHAMIQAAFRMGRLIPCGALDAADVMRVLLAIWCDRWRKTQARGIRTISRGLHDGQQHPRTPGAQKP